MATLNTLSLSDSENSYDSLPDLAGNKNVVPVGQKPESFTMSSDEEDSHHSENSRESVWTSSEKVQEDLPDVCDIPVAQKPEIFTLSSDEEDNHHSGNSRESVWTSREKVHEDLPDVCDSLNLSFIITEDEEPDMVQVEEQPLSRPLKKLRTEEVRTEQEAKRRQREKERQRIAAEKTETKANREAERTIRRAMMPGVCMKYVVVEVDRGLVEAEAGSQVVGRLGQDGGGTRYRVVDAPVPAAVTFLRVDPLTLQESQTDEAIVLMGTQEFVSGVEQQMYGGMENGRAGLCQICRAWQRKLSAPRLTLVVCGIDQYFKGQKSKKQQWVRSTVLGEISRTKKGNKKNHHSSSGPSVTRVDIETALVMAQLECGLNHRLLSDPEKVATYILQVTKAVAEAPFKHERSKAVFSWYAQGSTIGTGSVRVDKNGVGLLKLWHQQLCQFRNVRMEMAQSVAREYPGPKALMQAYKKCSTRQEASMLLADIPVRRGTGILASTRRIGPALSRKIHVFLTATDPDLKFEQKT